MLIVGGYGVFGRKLAHLLSKTSRFDVLIAGRSIKKAEAACREIGATPVQIDITASGLEKHLNTLDPFIVVDAAGPFQAYGQSGASYRLAKACIACGAHYLDFSDDAAFTRDISSLHETAQSAQVSVLSGVSSVPAISSSIVAHLANDIDDIHLIDTAILPGNKAPRGLSVVQAIVGQAGRTMRIWSARKWQNVKGWSGRKSVSLDVPGTAPLKNRWASFIGAPDLVLFPDYFKARSVQFRAGLDLKIMHGGLALISLPVRWGWLNSIQALSPLLKWIADRLERLGSDRGGMQVCVVGTQPSGAAQLHKWTLIAENGDGPFIPAIPAKILCEKLLDGSIMPGARPGLDLFTKVEVENALSALGIKTHTTHTSLKPLFAASLADDVKGLPEALQNLHCVLHTRRWIGKGSVERGSGILSRLCGFFAGLPPATEQTDVEVLMTRTPKGETWRRTFGTRSFCSYLSKKSGARDGMISERFGLLSFAIRLTAENDALYFPIVSGTCFGVPLPGFLLPHSKTREFVDAQGRACFDVSISLPIAGHVASYKGWLQEA